MYRISLPSPGLNVEKSWASWKYKKLAWIWAESSETEFRNLYAAVLGLLNTSSGKMFLIWSLEHPWIPLWKPLSHTKTQRNPRLEREEEEKKKRRKIGKATCCPELKTAEERAKRRLDSTKSQDSRRTVCCWLFASARAVGHPSERFKHNSSVSTFLDPYLFQVTSNDIQHYT